jgi:integrase
VPLSPPAMALLERMAAIRDGSGSVFLSQRRGGRMSDTTLSAVLKRMGRDNLTVHGFRSTFRDWAAEATNSPNHVVEMALAHTIGSAVERAYRRGDLFEKRRTLMEGWATFLAQPAATVMRLPKGVIVSKHSDADLRRAGIRVIEPSGKGFVLPL